MYSYFTCIGYGIIYGFIMSAPDVDLMGVRRRIAGQEWPVHCVMTTMSILIIVLPASMSEDVLSTLSVNAKSGSDIQNI